MAVDNLVADDISDIFPISSLMGSANPSRSGTPTIPPGFEGLGHPSPPKTFSRMEPKTAPFTPSRSTSFAHATHVATPLANVSLPVTPIQRVATPILSVSTSKAKAKTEVKALAADTGLSNEIAAQRDENQNSTALQPEDFPVLEKGKGKETAPVGAPPVATPSLKKTTSVNSLPTANIPATPTPKSSKRQTPGILNITAAVHATPSTQAPKVQATETIARAPTVAADFPALPPSTTNSNNIQTATTRAAPKTLRLVSTPKIETMAKLDPASASASTPASAVPVPVLSISSMRQASLALASKLDRPGTPASEQVSDAASLPSTTMSRPNSPPPNKVGSAPVREKTKSQQKKHRKEAQKEKEKLEVEAPREPELEQIAPLEGRKKKQKKEKVKNSTSHSTPAASRAASPGPPATAEVVKPPKPEPIVEKKSEQSRIPEPEEPYRAIERKGKGRARQEEFTPPPPPLPAVEIEKEPEKPVPTPMVVLNELLESGDVELNSLSILKPLNTNGNHRSDIPANIGDFEPRLVITDEDRAELQAGRPVHKVVHENHRIMLTPNGECIRNLTAAEEQRYLQLQNSIASSTGPAAFVPNRHMQTNGFALIQGRAVPNGPPSWYPHVDAGSDGALPLDAVGKIQRDEALSYINQFVLPSLSTNSQLERALNANAIDAGMHPPGTNANQSWYGVNPIDTTGHVDSAYGSAVSDGGILATGLESMTAHFAVGNAANARGQPLGNVTLLNLSDAETALVNAKKETEKLEKQFNYLLKKNRKLLLGAGH